ncbi:AAA family ATPase [Frankia tisae]|uniref:AAA family ATPase n=1 Tax=Frankia tisae TaxID=2950104 RepID=UPI0034D58C63
MDGVLRRSEVSLLTARLVAARGGRLQVVVIEGESGVGKTTLVRQFLDGLDKVSVLAATGDETEQMVPFASIAQLLIRARSRDRSRSAPAWWRWPAGSTGPTGPLSHRAADPFRAERMSNLPELPRESAASAGAGRQMSENRDQNPASGGSTC